jgi:hypothetical protein
MPFKTKLDFSDNRQVKQRPETLQVLSGATSFGLPFSALTTGPNLLTSGVTQTYFNVLSSFSGNSGTTIYSWYDSRMTLGEASLSAITPSNSATTQNSSQVYSSSSTIIIDGNLVNLSYSGVNFNVVVTGMTDLGGGNYSGDVVTTTLQILSANTLDFTGRGIWVDVSGITRTDRLIITQNPQVGYVWTCVDGEGMGNWMPSSGGTSGSTGLSADTYWISGSTGAYSIHAKNPSGLDATGAYAYAEGNSTLASGAGSHAEGTSTTASNANAHAEGNLTTASNQQSHAEGYNTHASGLRSHVEGAFSSAGGSYSHAEGNSTHADGDNSHAEGIATRASGTQSHAEGNATSASGTTAHAEGYATKANGFISHAEGESTIASGQGSHAEGGYTLASGLYSHAEGGHSTTSVTASGDYSHAEGDSTTASGQASHAGGYLTIAIGTNSFVHGNNSSANSTNTVVLGANLTGTNADTTYVDNLNISTVGAGPSTIDIGVDATGHVVNVASDITLKENITTIDSALNKVLGLRGVYFNWKDKITGGNARKIGFIAQEVEPISPELVYTHTDGLKTVHYKDISALLVEAVKELASGTTTSGNVYLETQTIFAEDNDIQLNYSGTSTTAIGGGLKILHAMGQDITAELITDADGNWTTNNDFKAKSLTIPTYTPSSSSDATGSEGNITRDDNYMYVKCKSGWKRSNLETF